ncbi:MAG: ATP-binding protein [Gemmatimonadales bacterium]
MAEARAVKAAPSAAVLIESMRDIGYSLDTAIADLIDNAITAQATQIQLLVSTPGVAPAIGVLDDGHGMTEAELLSAMRLGSRDPRERRERADLGRFGLGLKTASFSQCRCLTVVTRRAGLTAAATWDLDYVNNVQDWLLTIPADPMTIRWTDKLGESGTLVLWEKLDRHFTGASDRTEQDHFVYRLNDTCEHLQLTFHRFLAGEPGSRKVEIKVNGRPLVAFDPFCQSHPATIIGPKEDIQVAGSIVAVQPFTLPHHHHVSPQQWEANAGRAGYLRNQGFYVYREKRLLLHGTWFGLTRASELTRLSRVRVDMPNSLDSAWQIDVKKASAQLPPAVRKRLKAVIEQIVLGSKRVYRSRGVRVLDDARLPVWRRIHERDKVSYRVNQDHPFIGEFGGELPPELRTRFGGILELVGAALPVDAFFADLAADPRALEDGEMSDEALRHVVGSTFRQLVATGMTAEDIVALLQVTSPFDSNWDKTAQILRDLDVM